MRMIPKKETLTIEFKSDIGGLDEKELVSEIVGMTNTEGGVLYLGVEDNGDITGVHKKHKDPNGAMAMIANKQCLHYTCVLKLLKKMELRSCRYKFL